MYFNNIKNSLGFLALCIVLLTFSKTNAQNGQIGINTDSPAATLHIKADGNSQSTSSFKITDSSSIPLLELKDDASLIFGTTTKPEILIDLRDNTANFNKNILGIGYTSTDAVSAGGGALRYNPETKLLEYSDGKEWRVINNRSSVVCVIASNYFKKVAVNKDVYTNIGNWDIISDSSDSFDANTGVFTAPKTGMYIATFSVFTEISTFIAGTYFQGEWISSNGNTIKALNNYLTDGRYMIGISCSGIISLTQGDTLRPRVIHNGPSLNLRYDTTGGGVKSNQNFNNLSIVLIQQ